MLNKIRKSRIARVTALTLVVLLLAEVAAPTAAYALTSGPSQPEVQSFEPIATTDMVDPFTGDFNYNIPIMQVGHYPINLFYHAGIGMDQEASWTGLGWNINPGVINRNMRGIPDDFKGDIITKDMNIKSDVTVGLRLGLKLEMFGFSPGEEGLSFRLYYNNYKGVGHSVGIGTGNKNDGALNLNLDLDSQEGVSVDLSFQAAKDNADKGSGKQSLGLGYNSRSGLKQLTLTATGSIDHKKKLKNYKGTLPMISFVSPTFTPSSTPGMGSFLGSLRIAFDGASYGFLAGGSIGADVHVHGIMDKSKDYPTAGYLYAGYNDDVSTLQDFNRDKEVSINKFTKHLHTTNHSYDTYSVTGQGTGGMYRPYRGNVGMVYDPVTDNSSAEGFSGANLSIGLELGVGGLAEMGADINAGVSLSHMRPWESNFLPFEELQFTKPEDNISDIYYEHSYFKTVGEKTAADQEYFDKFLDTKAVYFPLDWNMLDTKALPEFKAKDNSWEPISAKITRTKRDRRNQHISYLTAEEARMVGFQDKIEYYVEGSSSPLLEDRKNTMRKAHHISEIIVTNPDGTRYVYGLPAYNTLQEEYSFSVDDNNTIDLATGLVDYNGTDASEDNTKGRDHYYSKETIPPYAYAYLLTAVLSPDYVDVNDDGITEDDWGTYTKVNYLQAYGAGNPYRWRTPYTTNEENPQANYNRGLKSDTQDDKANFIYGEKEVYYVHSIETKTHRAAFILNPLTTARADGNGVAGRNGGMASDQSLRYLDKVVLYSKSDFIRNGVNAVPIKTAHFQYDYSLCKNSPNNSNYNAATNPPPENSGKLTLKELSFTYGNNTSGVLSPYVFNYNESDIEENPPYELKGSDRWGNYKRQPGSGDPYNWEFPYTNQEDRSIENINAGAWCLKDFKLPSGGQITVNYESDDYAYVQNRRAQVMTKVLAVTKDDEITSGSELYDHLTLNHDPHLYLHFAKDAEIQATDMVMPGDTLYFNFSVNLTTPNGTPKYEVITGYAGVDDVGGSGTAGWLKLKAVRIETGFNANHEVNPISKAAWQFTRLYRPALAYDGSDWTETAPNITDIIYGILGSVSSICQMIAGFNQDMEFKGKGNKVQTDGSGNIINSWIRLNAPKTGKLGGGHRVSKIEFEDTWDAMTGSDENEMTYGQEFTYADADGNSYGVAAYEPLIGGDENACRLPVADYTFDRILAPDDNHYVEGPFGEQFYPGPTVGYSMVTVKNIKPKDEYGDPLPINRHGTGKTVHEFYTAKEFPVYAETTPFEPVVKPADPILSFLAVYTREYATASQGYAIEINDMHGKQKAISVYAEPDPDNTGLPVPPVSKITYHYKVDDPALSSKRLNNEVLVMNKKGEVLPAHVGKDIEMVVDSKQKRDEHMTAGIQINVDGFVVGIIPAIIPIPWPELSWSERRLRYAVNTKVINRFGILERTEAMQNGGATISTWNEIYDEETGEVLLTRTVNEHNDQLQNPDNDFVYNFNYPAHWAYDRMGQAYKNTGVTSSITIDDGIADLSGNLDAFYAFVPGDEVMLYTGNDVSTAIKAWVLDKDINSGEVSFIDQFGDRIRQGETEPETYNFKIIRSGRRNQQATSVGSVVSLKSPVNSTTNELDVSPGTEIINSSATVFSDEWQTPGDKGSIETSTASCSLGENGDAFADFLNDLLANNFTTEEPVQFETVPPFIDPDEGCDPSYSASTIDYGNYQAIVLQFSCGGCIIRIYGLLPQGVSIEDITSFSDDLTVVNSSYNSPNLYITVNTGSKEETIPLYMIQHHYTAVCMSLLLGIDCLEPEITVDECDPGRVYVNPYLNGLRGIWKPEKGYAYNSTRHYSGAANALNARSDGYYDDFDAFWRPNILGENVLDWKLPDEINNPDPAENKWVWTSEVTKCHPAGYEVENKDALGRYSSALYHYWYTQPSAVASNAQYREIAFDGFEDYRFQENYGPGTCHYLDHWSFTDAFVNYQDELNSVISHTGKTSLEIEGTIDPGEEGNVRSVTREIIPSPSGNHNSFMSQYQLLDIDKLGIFSPLNNEKYVLGMWVNKNDPGQSYEDIIVRVNFFDENEDLLTTGNYEWTATSDQPVIENWKRFEKTIEIPEDAHFIVVEFENQNDNAVYFDDIRIQPFNSSMKTFVYDPVSLKLMAQLDENNYATFYEYDDQGNLIRTKKETERGIVTLQENRQSIYKP